MNKKLVLSVLSTAVVASMATSAFAAPKAGLYIGGNVDKYYSTDALLGLTGAAKTQFQTYVSQMVAAGLLDQVVYVDAAGKGANVDEILDAGSYEEAKKDPLKATDFEDTYTEIKADGTSAGTIEPKKEFPEVPTGDLKVESVSAINANQILVTFNAEVDETSATNKANYLVNNGTQNATLDTTATWTEAPAVELQADKKSVLITLDTDTDTTYQTLANQVEATVVVSGVKSKDGSKTAPTATNKLTLTDTTVPTVTGVSMSGNKTIKVQFSEFVKPDQATTVANYQLNGVSLSAYGAGAASWDASTNTVSIPLSTALADGNYKLKVSVNNSIEDKVAFKVVAVEKDLVVKADTTAPTFTGVEVAANKSYILVKFSKPLASTGYAIGAPLTIDGINVIGSATIAKTIENGNLKLTSAGAGTDYNSLIAAGLHAVNVKNDSTNYFTDAFGVKATAGSNSYTITADTTKPTVSAVTVGSGATSIEVKFSEAVDAATALNRFNYTITTASGSTVTASNAAFKSGTTDTVVLTVSALASGNYTLAIANVKDAAANAMDAYSTTFSVADLVGPSVSNVYVGASNSIYVYYNEAVNAATATDLNNYQYDNKALPTGTTATLVATNAVKLVLPSGTTVATGKAFAISSNVTDLAGNKMTGFGYSTTLSSTLANDLGLSTGTAVKAIDTKTVQVTLNKELKSLDASDFEFNTGTGGAFAAAVTQQNATFVNSNGKATITFVFSSDVMDNAGNSVAASAALKVRVKQSGAYGTVATDDTTFVNTAVGGTSGTNAVDTIAPTLVTTNPITSVDADNDGQIDAVKVQFTEALDANYLSATSFEVTGYTVTAVALDTADVTNKTVKITVTESGTADTDATPGVKRTGTVKDVAGNAFAGLTTASAAKDASAPVIVSAKYVDADASTTVNTGDKVEITFSEAVQLASGAALTDLANDFALSNSTSPTFGTGATFAISGNKVTVTLGTSPALTAGTTKVELTATGTDVSLTDASGTAAAVSAAAKTIAP